MDSIAKMPARSLHLVALVSVVMLASVLAPHARADVADPRFVEEVVHRGAGMISVAFTPSGTMFVAEKRGRVLVFQPSAYGFHSPRVLLDMRAEVSAPGECGLLGMRLDPSFASNRYLYLFFTTASDQRLVRMQVNASYTGVVTGSRVDLLTGLPRATDFHKAGDIRFHPTDASSIFISIGDDGQRDLAQDVDRYHGKILRVSKTDGRGLADNPFATSNLDSVRSRVWAIGFRNPYRIAFHPSAPSPDVLYVADNGDDQDRVSRVTRGSNGAWSSAGNDGGFLSPPDPGHYVMDVQQPYLTGILIARGGIFAEPAGADVLLLGNGSRGISRYHLTGAALDTLEPLDGGRPFASNLNAAPAVDMVIAPDGALYFTQANGGESDGGFYTLRRIRSSGMTSAQRPIAAFSTTPSPAVGAAPLSVQLTDMSSDPDGSVVQWSWSFGDGATSTERNPTHVYATPGERTITLNVTDDTGLTSTEPATAAVTVQGAVQLSLNGRVFDGTVLFARGLPVATELRLYDGSTAHPIAFSGGIGPDGNGVAVPPGGDFSVTTPIALSSGRLLVSFGEPASDGLHPAYRAFIVPPGTSQLSQWVAVALSSVAIAGQVLDTRGVPATIDIGVARGAPDNHYPLLGGRDTFRAPTGVPHRLQTDQGGYYYISIRPADAGATFYLDLLADTNTGVYTGDDFSVFVGASAVVARDVLVGRRAGGRFCNNLSSIPVTPNVSYETQIEPIFQAQCAGCHSPTASDSGGLDLQTDGFAALVDVPSGLVPGLPRVTPGDLAGSFLFEKINCDDPQRGTRMRPTDAMPLSQQALIRDWILQLQ